MAWFARKTRVDFLDRAFASQREANRAVALAMMEKAGEIRNLEFQPRWPFRINGVYVGEYTGDFKYEVVATGDVVVEDVKAPGKYRVAGYSMRRKLMRALYGIDVKEVA